MDIKEYFNFEKCFQDIIKENEYFLKDTKYEEHFWNKKGISFGKELNDFIENEKYGCDLIIEESQITENEVVFEFGITTNQTESDPIGDWSSYTVVYSISDEVISDFYWEHG